MYSIVDLAGSQGQSNFAFNFPYLSEAHIHVYIDGLETEDFTFSTTSTITLDVALSAGATVRIRRITPIDEQLVNFSNGSVLGETDLDSSVLQVLYAQQELDDENSDLISMQLANGGSWDAQSEKIINLASPSDPTDAANKSYVDAQLAAFALGEGLTLTAIDGIDPAAVIDAGTIMVGDGGVPSILTGLPRGNDEEILEVDTAEPTNLKWIHIANKMRHLLVAKGDLLVANDTNTTQRLPVGADDLVLVADSGESTGVKWSDPATIPTVEAAIAAGVDAQGAALGNALINGDMDIWQRGLTFASPMATGQYMADRWVFGYVSSATYAGTQSADVPDATLADRAFNYSLLLTPTIADAAVAAADYLAVMQHVEGYNWLHYAQRPLVVGFWVKAAKNGTYCVSLCNSGNNRSCVAEYTISVADTWEYKTVTFPASPSAGTWDGTNGVGVQVRFCIMGGTNFHATAGSWQTGNFLCTSNQVNGADSVVNLFRLTGVKLIVGTEDYSVPKRPFGQELALCQRYYEKSFQLLTKPAQNTGATELLGSYMAGAFRAGANLMIGSYVTFAAAKRTSSPTLTFYNPDAANAEARDRSVGADCSLTTYRTRGERGFVPHYTGAAGTSVGNEICVHWTAECEL
jgi:hypothetical protein